MDELPGCKTRWRRDGICCWTISGAISGGVGLVWPVVLMAWNFIWQPIGYCFACGGSAGTVESCLLPVWFCAKAPCACGSCSALGTTWLGIVTFAGFTGAAWYITIGNLAIVAGLVCFAIALVYWAISCAIETPEPKEVDLEDPEAAPLVVPVINTGEIKF